MPLTIHEDPVPLSAWDDGSVRVGGTRLLLAVVLECFKDGHGIEAVLEAFPDAPAADLYASIAYYLRHRDEVDAYLAEREVIAAKLREDSERDLPMGVVKRRLERRRAGRHAAAGG